MPLESSHLAIVHLLGLVQALFLLVLLQSPAYRNAANARLTVLIGLLAVSLWEAWLNSSGLQWRWVAAVGWFSFAPFLFGPALYAYVRQVVGAGAQRPWIWLFHLLPAALHQTLALRALLLPEAEKRLLMQQAESIDSAQLHPVVWAMVLIKLILLAAYGVAAWRLLGSYRRRWMAQSADSNLFAVDWLRRLLAAFLVYPVVGVAVTCAEALGWAHLGPGFDQVFWLMLVAMAFAIAYWSLSQPGILQSLPQESDDPPTAGDAVASEPTPSSRYAKSGLSEQGASELAEQLLQQIRNQGLHLQAGLKLADLAAACDVPPHLVSQAINQHLADNFFDLINRLRVEEAQRRLADPRWSSRGIAEIAFDCGFNNRMSFNTAFRKHAGATPSDFRKSLSGNEKSEM